METQGVFRVVGLINVSVCFPLALVVFCFLGQMVKNGNAPVYYINLLVAVLVQLCTMMFWLGNGKRTPESFFVSIAVYCFGALAALGFRMCIALKRYFLIAYPEMQCFRTRVFVLLSAAVWGACLIAVPLSFVCTRHLPYSLAIIPAPVFIFCLVRGWMSLPAATSVPAEEKRGAIATLLVLLLSYFITVLPTVILDIVGRFHLFYSTQHVKVVEAFYTLTLLSPFTDLFLFVCLPKGPMGKLLTRLCCRKETSSSAMV